MSQADNDSTTVMTTEHPHIFYASPAFDRGELEVATTIADAIDEDWRIVITMGPYRGYDVHYDLKPDARIVHLDFYSVRPASGYDLSTVINDIETGINGLS